MLIKTSTLALAMIAFASLHPALAEADTGMLQQNRDDLRGIQIEQQNRQRENEDRALAARQRAANEAAGIRARQAQRRRETERERR